MLANWCYTGINNNITSSTFIHLAPLFRGNPHSHLQSQSHSSILKMEVAGSSQTLVESSWNVVAHGDAWEGKWRGNWRMECVAITLHYLGTWCIQHYNTDAHTSAASSRLNWRPCRFKWTRPFRRKTKSGFCACAITFQTQSNSLPNSMVSHLWRI